MTLKCGVLLACAAAACSRYDVRVPQPPSDRQARMSEEVDACRRNTLPPWLDDGALSAAAGVDAREAQASSANDQFRGALYTSQPPPSQSGTRTRQVLEERREFETWCTVFRSAGKSLPGT